MRAIQAETRVKRTGKLLETEVDGEVVALDVEKGQCYGLDEVGTEIWHLLSNEISVAQICQALTDKYDVDSETCVQDVVVLIMELHSEGLVSVWD
jgi:hypothetical protein